VRHDTCGPKTLKPQLRPAIVYSEEREGNGRKKKGRTQRRTANMKQPKGEGEDKGPNKEE